jgi:hypothetical protein
MTRKVSGWATILCPCYVRLRRVHSLRWYHHLVRPLTQVESGEVLRIQIMVQAKRYKWTLQVVRPRYAIKSIS